MSGRLSGVLHTLSVELGITALRAASRDVYLILLTRFLRMFAYGSSTLVLAIYFEELGFSDIKIGLFMTLTLVGDVLISMLLTFVADALGRRRILTAGSLLMTVSGGVFATMSNYWILLLAAMIGVISPSGNEIGPFRAVEESTLAHLTAAETRATIFAWYVVFGTLGTAGGALTSGWATQGLQNGGWTVLSSFRVVFWLYGAIGLIKAAITLLLSSSCELKPAPTKATPLAQQTRDGEEQEEQEPFLNNQGNAPSTSKPPEPKKSSFSTISQKSRGVLIKLCGLFFFDSLASGMMPNSLIVLYISRKFQASESELGSAVAAAQFMSSIGNILASSVAKRIGLVRTMVFTHLPSAIMLGLLPAPTSIVLTVVLLIGRASLASMDQAPRSAFLAAIVLPEERTAVMGVVNTVKTMSQSSGPLITGVLAKENQFWAAFVIAGSLKAGYDLAMLKMFASTKIEGDRSAKPADQAAELEDFAIGQDDDIESRSSGSSEFVRPSDEHENDVTKPSSNSKHV